jgi:hypothetical protein
MGQWVPEAFHDIVGAGHDEEIDEKILRDISERHQGKDNRWVPPTKTKMDLARLDANL